MSEWIKIVSMSYNPVPQDLSEWVWVINSSSFLTWNILLLHCSLLLTEHSYASMGPLYIALKMGSLEAMLAIVQNGCYFVTHEMNLWLVYISVFCGSSQSDLQDKWFITWRILLLTSGSHYHPYLFLSFVTHLLSFYLHLFLFSSIFSFLICLSCYII